jgi:hypothetical protein
MLLIDDTTTSSSVVMPQPKKRAWIGTNNLGACAQLKKSQTSEVLDEGNATNTLESETISTMTDKRYFNIKFRVFDILTINKLLYPNLR